MKKILLACVLSTLTVLPALAADNLWVGAWKLDAAKSHFTGDTFTYSKAASGMMHYSDGSTVNYDFGIDGKEYKTLEGRTTVWSAAGPHSWDSVARYNGTILSKAHRELSTDGKTLTIVSTGTRPDGSDFKTEETYTRVTGTKGLEGKWKSTKVNISSPDGYLIKAMDASSFQWEIPAYKESVAGKTDGSETPITGPTVPPGMTLSVKYLTPRKISVVVKESGKPTGYGTNAISADGKTMTEINWSPGKESEKSTAIYSKQ